MSTFEVFIPSTDPDGFNITARIQADSWIHALRAGLAKLGDTADVRNIMVDIKETGIEVTDPQSGRVFRIRELDAQGGAPGPAPAAAPAAAPAQARTAPAAAPPPAAGGRSAAPPAAAPMRGAPPPAAPARGAPPPAAQRPPLSVPVAARPPAAVAPAPIPQAAHQAAPGPQGGRVGLPSMPDRFKNDDVFDLETARVKTTEVPKEKIGRGIELSTSSVEDLLGDLFVEVQDVYQQGNLRAAARFLLDLAVRSIPSESGAVFLADINTNELTFAAAVGPKADEVMKYRVPMGVGIVGFCAQEAVSLAVSDVEKDKHFYAAISQKVGYPTRSILCCPAKQEGRVFGAIELINKKGGATFTADEVNVLNYLANELADFLVSTGQTGA